jgi:predicted RecB family nuclease
MRLLAGDWIFATTDLTKFVRCDYATFLDRATKSGSIKPLAMLPHSAMAELIAKKGSEHEHRHLDSLKSAGRQIVTIGKPPWTIDDLQRGEAATVEAMRSGAEFIYQAAFFDGRWAGYADLLQRVDRPSANLAWSYEVVDLKLARAVKGHFVLQLCDYTQHVARLQGTTPELMHVVLGNNDRASFRVADFDAYYRHVHASLEHFIARDSAPVSYPVEFCPLCDWRAHCRKQWNDEDHLSLVANIRRSQVAQLERAGITTLTALGEASPQLQVRKIPRESFNVLQHQARLQLEHRRTGIHKFEPLPIESKRGFLRLPHPSPGDVFIDLEGDPFAGAGLTYLFGAAWEENGNATYRAWWAHDDAEEQRSFENLIDFLVAKRAVDRDMHVYHYGAADVATFERLMGSYASRENEIDDFLRQAVFVDLSAIVRQAMRISRSSYGLKSIESFYLFDRKNEGVADAGGAVLAYEQWLDTNDPAMLYEIKAYNREDCLSTIALRRWLLDLRPADLEWPVLDPPRPSPEEHLEEDAQKDEQAKTLLAMNTPEARLLAHLLRYHAREEKPAWWWFFNRKTMSPEELIEDSESIGDLRLNVSLPPIADRSSKIFTYKFPPQDHKFNEGDDVFDAQTGERAGEIVRLDDGIGALQLKRGPALLSEPHPRALIPRPAINSRPLRDALRRFAAAIIEHGFDAAPHRAGVDILLNRPPRVHKHAPGDTLRDVHDVIRRLDESYLFIQGPPGSGKTWTGARVIVDLLRRGKRIGITSNSHKAIHNLLEEIEKVARESHYWFRGLKKANSASPDSIYTSKLPNPMIETTTSDANCADARVRLIAGTAWLMCNEAMTQSFDYLFVEEAGQVSLANVIAMSAAAHNIVLLGDPLQLAQVSQGSHPEFAGASVLEHLLGDRATVPSDRGIFLEETWRMHPNVCAFVSDVVYESRLHSAPVCATQAVTIDGVVETGLRFLAVEHIGNAQSSDEEALRVATEIRRLLRGTFTNSEGRTVPLHQSHFLVVAAYNAQVRRLTRALHGADLRDVPVGTVDKFQGRQAPIVFFSMATSSGADLPRDIDFLFSRNRLNVAVSRARCLAILVANPRLLDIACKTTEQMRLVNRVCRFVEMAS